MQLTTETRDVCPWCHRPIAADAYVCIQCGFDLRTSKVRETTQSSDDDDLPPPPKTWRQRYATGGLEDFVDFEIPVVMLVAGLAFILFAHLFTSGFSDFFAMLKAVLIIGGANVGWTLAGMAVMELLLDGSFGPFKEQLLKVSAIYAVVLAVATAAEAVFPFFGPILIMSFGIRLLLVFVMFKMLFTLDMWWAFVSMMIVVTANFFFWLFGIM